ncbi:MAG: hypothetical protein ACJ74H_08845 [Thermoanaerobaculia bacterium]
MPDDLLERAVAESRAQTALGLREALRNASPAVLRKLAVDLVPPLFRNEYRGEPAQSGDGWADAIAQPRIPALPSFLVRVHLGAFVLNEVESLLAAMMVVHAPQSALVIIGPPVVPDVRNALGTVVPWLIDMDGLIHLMMTAKVGVGTRICEATHVDADYFR